jgi:hypothetical protein
MKAPLSTLHTHSHSILLKRRQFNSPFTIDKNITPSEGKKEENSEDYYLPR